MRREPRSQRQFRPTNNLRHKSVPHTGDVTVVAVTDGGQPIEDASANSQDEPAMRGDDAPQSPSATAAAKSVVDADPP